ncbi:MAG: hypothetical protein PHQ72_11840 [Hespellia sp.]|nr:hypothetical protein [Hespellia sp.]
MSNVNELEKQSIVEETRIYPKLICMAYKEKGESEAARKNLEYYAGMMGFGG